MAMTPRRRRRALPRFAVLSAAAGAAFTFGLVGPASAADEGTTPASESGEVTEGATAEGAAAEVTSADAGSTAYVVVGVVGAIVLVGLAAAVASDRNRDALAGDAHH
jgi:hypothetical protein